MFTPPRAAVNRTDSSQLTQHLLQALALASTAQVEGLQQTRDTQVVLGALLQTEAQRLTKKYGPNHGRVQQINASLQRNAIAIHDLDIELELANVRQPDVDEKAALMQGRVSDQNGRGIAGLIVFLGDGKRQPLRFLGSAETDLAGYFALVVAPDTLARLPEAAPDGVFLTVSTRQGRVVHQRPEAIQLQGGNRLTLEVVLNRDEVSTDDSCKPTEPPPPPVPKDWVVRGQVVEARTGGAMAGVQVNAIDNNRRFDDKLGSAITDSKGEFRITYDFKSPVGTAERGPDLYVTVIDEAGKELFSSQKDLRRNASRDEEFKIAIASQSPPDTPTEPNLPLDGSVLWFETRSTKLRQDDDRLNGERLLRAALRRAQTFLLESPSGQIALHGYASTEEGARAEALALSQKRAEVVQAALVQSNIPAAQISVTAHGINATYPEVKLNQRVELIMSAGRPVVDRPVVDRPVVDRPVVDRPIVDRPVNRPGANPNPNPSNPGRS